MKKYLVNALSINMFNSAINAEKERLKDTEWQGSIYPVIEIISAKDIPNDIISAIGHADTANILSGILGFHVEQNRISVDLGDKDVLYIAQYIGPRLQEGSTTLPEGAHFEFFRVHIGATFPADMCSGGIAVY